VADPLEEHACRIVAAIATVWFAVAASWELFGPLLAGHYASSASVGVIADNMLKWRIWGPVWEYTALRPAPGAYYCHHPWGIFWTTAALMKILGRHDYVCRLAPVLLSAATPPLLYAIGRSVWRPAAGAAAAASFVVLPIALAFANFNALEVPVITWTLFGLWGYIRLTQMGRRRHLAAAAVGLFFALHCDWPAFIFAGTLLGFGMVRGLLLPELFEPLANSRRYAAFCAIVACGAILTLGLYLALFQRSGKLDDLIGSYGFRAAGNTTPLAKVLAERRYWIELSFTPIAIALGKIGAIVALVRLFWLRREHEALPLFYLLMAGVQYIVFKQGADIHIFWPHYFAGYFALAMGAMVATGAAFGEAGGRWIAARRGRPASPALRPRSGAAALSVALLPIAAIGRDGVPALRYARETGGRFNEKGLLIHSDGAKTAFLRFIEPALPKNGVVEMHVGMKTTWSQIWAFGGRIVAPNRPIPRDRADRTSAYLADARFLPSDAQSELATRFHVTAVGPFWRVTPGEPAAPIDAFAIEEREPSWWEWYFLSGTEPVRWIVPDPYLTWELRFHFGQPAEAPVEPPRSLEQKRIAHNIAVAGGELGRAAALRAELERELLPVHAEDESGAEIIGTTFHEGARSRLTIYVLAGGAMPADVQLAVRSKVVARAPLSLTMADPTEREVGLPLMIAPERWKAGFLYSDRVPIRKRPGMEVFHASFERRGMGSAPRSLSFAKARAPVLMLGSGKAVERHGPR
jgi:hypothetical protein